jgi:hypothetical protein
MKNILTALMTTGVIEDALWQDWSCLTQAEFGETIGSVVTGNGCVFILWDVVRTNDRDYPVTFCARQLIPATLGKDRAIRMAVERKQAIERGEGGCYAIEL